MKRIVINACAVGQLKAMPHSVEICDEMGKVIGRFFPTADTGESASIVLDADTIALLWPLIYRAALCDSCGNVLGCFYRRTCGYDMCEWEFIGPDPDEEEFHAIDLSNAKTYTTAEVLAHLHSL